MRLVTILAATLLMACTGAPDATPEAPTDAPKADAKAHGAGHGDHAVEPDAATFKPLEGASVAFAEPVDGATVSSPVKVVMTVTGASVKAAGVPETGTGHHHILVDTDPTAAGTTVPKDETHIHFGDGSTESELTLAPGKHTLTLQFADGMHRSYGPAVSQTITITVAE
ncbi:MAG: DUF4399 domain-containing protein [Myxococcota bacterium]